MTLADLQAAVDDAHSNLTEATSDLAQAKRDFRAADDLAEADLGWGAKSAEYLASATAAKRAMDVLFEAEMRRRVAKAAVTDAEDALLAARLTAELAGDQL